MKKEGNKISFLITHYNRPKELVKCINAIKKVMPLHSEIVVSDDASSLKTIRFLNTLQVDKIVYSSVNRGLAHNINKGIKACNGNYIVYCQEDFVLSETLKARLPELIAALDDKTLDLIRLTSNFRFNTLFKIKNFKTIALIPKFSCRNFFQNYYRYSDHPFITSKKFFENYGYYLENTSGRYGETEYSARIFNTNAKIGITHTYFASLITGSASVLINEKGVALKKINLPKKIIQLARAFRLYFEFLCYNKTKRGLLTYKNGRKNNVNTDA